MASDKWVSTGGVAFELDTTFDAARHAELVKYFLEPVRQDAGPRVALLRALRVSARMSASCVVSCRREHRTRAVLTST